MASPATPAIPAIPATPATPANRLVLTIETDACGLDAKQVVERFQKFFEFYHAAFNVKVKASAPATVMPAQPQASTISESVLD